jgi:ATP-dependent Clp protease ATP-binding subunit ClpC
MFERFTESARRAVFFARYEVSQLGATSIETEHVLLGLIRERKGLVARIFALSKVSPESIRKEIENRAVFRKSISTSEEVPFSPETKRILQFAAEEADRLMHGYIGTEHLLLGLLREETSVAASILITHGLRLAEVRNTIVKLPGELPTGSVASAGVEVSECIEEIRRLVQELVRMPSSSSEARDQVERIEERLDALKRHLAAT